MIEKKPQGKKEISYYELDLLGKIGVIGGWIVMFLLLLGLTTYLFLMFIL